MRSILNRNWIARAMLVVWVWPSAFSEAQAGPTPFVHEIVDAAGTVGQHTSLALDAQGNPRISYYHVTGKLKYASRVGNTWRIETVDATATGVGQYTSLALDAEGSPHISYWDSTSADLKYASRTSLGTWVRQGVDMTGAVGQYTSLALDAQANAHISYYDVTRTALKYARWTGSAWDTMTVDAGAATDVGQYTSLALDDLGNPRISYHAAGDLKYASRIGGFWNTEIADATGSVGQYTSLALDAQGNPRISYYDLTRTALKYVRLSGSVWDTVTVDVGPSTNVGQYTSLALDAQGNPRISYYDVTRDDLKFASWTGSAWSIETVDATGLVGQHTSLELDSEGNPRISYFDRFNSDLRYTDSAVHLLSPVGGERWAVGSRQSVHWSGSGVVSVDLSVNGGLTYTTLVSSVSNREVAITVPAAATNQARVRVSRSQPFSTSDSPGYFLIGPDLVSPWWNVAVEDALGVRRSGQYTSLALDAQGNPSIGYVESTTGKLRYARKSGRAWIIEPNPASFNADAQYISLELDAQGNPFISYYDPILGDLRVASKPDPAGPWMSDPVQVTADDMGKYNSFAIDALGKFHFSLYDDTSDNLVYVSNRNASLLDTVQVDTQGNVGQFTSLELDAQGNPRISYYDVTNTALKYATGTAGNFASPETEIVDDAGRVGQYTSLALDARGSPRISYYDETNRALKYARSQAHC